MSYVFAEFPSDKIMIVTVGFVIMPRVYDGEWNRLEGIAYKRRMRRP